jgi:Bacterioferritin (cytochrome b1)
MDDYSGFVSEFTAVSLYSYQHFIAEDSCLKSYSELIKCTSIVEMKHLELLAETILKLGFIPKYMGTHSTMGQFWNGGFVDYRRNIIDMLNIDITSELNAIRNYEKHISIIDDKYIKKLLRRIVADEEKHVELFKKELEKYAKQAI